MTSINDIPLELLEPIARHLFKQWLKDQQLDPSAKRRFIKLYRDVIGDPWTADEFAHVGASDDK